MNDLLNRAILLLASACALLVLASCDLSGPDEPLPFAWAEVGATFTYDFVPVVDSGYFDGGMVPVPSHTAEALTVRIILRDFGDVSAPIFNIFSMAGIPGHFSSIQLELSKFSRRSDGLYGIGLCEMVLPFQQAITKWEQMAQDNAYIANIRMFIVKRESGIEEVPRLYAGRCFFVDDPRSDFIPFATGDIYPSTLSERQNLFGLVEKRTGVSDYLTGRESPIIGTRATATSTLALIQEGTKRVEEVLENFREGFAEILLNCISIWMQYGLEGLDEMVLGEDSVAADVRKFFDIVTQTNIHGTIAIDLTATDASGSRAALQQMQLQLIQIMMGYYEKLLEAMSIALQMQQQPGGEAAVAVIRDTATAARKLFTDLLHDYNIRNPEDYLPDLEKYLGGSTTNGGPPLSGSPQGQLGAPQGQQGVPFARPVNAGPPVPSPAQPGSGAGPSNGVPLTGQGGGIQGVPAPVG